MLLRTGTVRGPVVAVARCAEAGTTAPCDVARVTLHRVEQSIFVDNAVH